MRAIYLKSLHQEQLNQSIEIDGDTFHHLINVVRVKTNDEILCLNGEGLSATGKITEIRKKLLILEIINLTLHEKVPGPALLIGLPKKDVLEEMLRMACECGIHDIFLVKTQYSPQDFGHSDRTDKILISSLEQSNNYYLPKVGFCKNIDEFDFSQFKLCVGFSPNVTTTKVKIENLQDTLILIGPEGGFSNSEIELFKTIKNFQLVKWNTPILRAKTALPFSIGFIHALKAL